MRLFTAPFIDIIIALIANGATVDKRSSKLPAVYIYNVNNNLVCSFEDKNYQQIKEILISHNSDVLFAVYDISSFCCEVAKEPAAQNYLLRIGNRFDGYTNAATSRSNFWNSNANMFKNMGKTDSTVQASLEELYKAIVFFYQCFVWNDTGNIFAMAYADEVERSLTEVLKTFKTDA